MFANMFWRVQGSKTNIPVCIPVAKALCTAFRSVHGAPCGRPPAGELERLGLGEPNVLGLGVSKNHSWCPMPGFNASHDVSTWSDAHAAVVRCVCRPKIAMTYAMACPYFDKVRMRRVTLKVYPSPIQSAVDALNCSTLKACTRRRCTCGV